MKLFLIRHGQTAANSQGLTQGSGSDEPLSDLGLSQAQAVANSLINYPISHIFSSPSKRAIETAAAISTTLGIPLEILPELTERNWGQWNRQPWTETQQKLAALSPEQRLQFNPPSGESEQEMADRLHSVVSRLNQTQEEGIVLVTHLAVLNLLIPLLLNEPLSTRKAYSLNNASLTVLEKRPNGYIPLLIGDRSHLD